MTRRYLFGPVTADFARENLQAHRESGDCLCFDADGKTDLRVGPDDDLESVRSRLPEGWQPDFVVLYLQYAGVPRKLWSAPVPLVGLAGDWNLLWHGYRLVLPRCDLVLTDAAGVDVARSHGIQHVEVANLFGCEKSFLEPAPEVERDIDILFVGNVHPAVQRERLHWLGRIARLSERWRVQIHSGVFGPAYRNLMRRARIVFNRSIRGECNLRAIESAAAGALLFQEAGNREVPNYFQDRAECVYYNDDDFEALASHYLEHEDERQRLAAAARMRAQEYSFEKLWGRSLAVIERELPHLQARMNARPTSDLEQDLLARTWQLLSAVPDNDPTLFRELRDHAEKQSSADVWNALGLVAARVNQRGDRLTASAAQAALNFFERAWQNDPKHVMAALNYAEALIGVGQADRARAQAEAILDLIDSAEAQGWDAGHFPTAFDHFRVEWERAAWQHASDLQAEIEAKRRLLRWRTNVILGDLTGTLSHFEHAHQARNDLPATQAAFGCALARVGRQADAIVPLRRAVTSNPFDAGAARALFQCLKDTNNEEGQKELIRERRLLVKAAPGLVPSEPWFDDKVPQVRQRASRIQSVMLEDFQRRFGAIDTRRAICGFTDARDTNTLVSLMVQARAKRILEIGTAAGHMTANFTEWSPDDAVVFTLGAVADMPVTGVAEQRYEDPDRSWFGRFANHFGKVAKVMFITADSATYDFARVAPLDFAFIDGAHDLQHVLSDSLKVYQALRPGGCIAWHDADSATPWVEVRQALEQLPFREAIYHVAGTQVAFLHKLAPVETHRAPAEQGRDGKTAILWEGAQRALHSFGHVNREVCRRLLERGNDLSLLPAGIPGRMEHVPGAAPPSGYREAVRENEVNLPEILTANLCRPLSTPADIHVRHQWPPDFTPPPSGRWVLVQPWEFGSLPKDWIEPLVTSIDEVWAWTRYVKDCYVESGVPADRVQVIPLGVDPAFKPGTSALPLRTTKSFKFLFVGGTIHRKGIDLLLEAYGRTFKSSDDVCLVIKDMGGQSFYQDQTASEQIAKLQAQPDSPEVEYIDHSLSQDELIGLYNACECLVHPYRGEGFGLPIVEAMACGLPVIVTGLGAALDFCREENAYLIPARRVLFSTKKIGDLETVGMPWLAEPDRQALAQFMRHVVENGDDAKAKGRAGSELIHREFTWDRTTEMIEQRFAELMKCPVRRHAVSSSDRSSGRMKVSLCMIVKNEENNLPDCLDSCRDLFDEIVVVDTGSTDRTKEVAARFGAKLADFPWIDSFCAARNESLRHATGDWVFWMDADDRLDEENRAKLKATLANLKDENVAYSMKCLCVPDKESGTATVVDHVRLFRNHPQLRWRYRVHEQILPAVRSLGGDVRWAEVVIRHVGYQDPALRRRKLDRDLRLLNLENEEHPDDPFTLFNLGMVYQELGHIDKAVPVLRRSLERSHPNDSIVRKLYALLAQCHRHLGQKELGLAACRKGREFYPDDTELLFQEGLACRELNDAPGAEKCWLRLLEGKSGQHFASVDTGIAGYKTRHNLAVMYREQKRDVEAEAQWRQALDEEPAFTAAWLGLGELYLGQQQWDKHDEVVRRLEQISSTVDAAILRARAHQARREYDRARVLLEDTIERAPKAVYPNRVLSHVLLQEGNDPMAAEKALRRLLELVPNDPEASNNLAVLLRSRQVR